jgi:hypothetical protein
LTAYLLLAGSVALTATAVVLNSVTHSVYRRQVQQLWGMHDINCLCLQQLLARLAVLECQIERLERAHYGLETKEPR